MIRDEAAETLERLAPPAPACFRSQKAWVVWLRAAVESDRPGTPESPIHFDANRRPVFNRGISFCADCADSFRLEQEVLGRCQPQSLLQENLFSCAS